MWPAIQQETNDGRRNGCDRKRRSRNLRRNDGRPTQRRKAKEAAPHSRDRRGYCRDPVGRLVLPDAGRRSEEHTSELQSLMRISYAVFCLKKKKITDKH